MSIGKVAWAVFWLGAAIILGAVLAYRVINWYIDRDLAKVGAEGSYVRYSTDLLKVTNYYGSDFDTFNPQVVGLNK